MTIYTFRVDVLASPVDTGQLPDLTGFDVEATNGHIGKIDEATYNDSSSCLVVDTGFWIFGKKRLVPAGAISSVEHDDKKLYVNMTKEQIKDAPDYDAEHWTDDTRTQHGEYYGRYSTF